MKKSLFSTKMIVATGLGAALFLVLFMFVKIPSPVPETNLQIAYGISTFFGVLFGPVCGFLTAFIGHALNDFIAYGSPWWSWIVASGVSGLIAGVAYYQINIEEGEFGTKEVVKFVLWTVIGNAVAWCLVAPGLDIVMYGEPANLVFTQGFVAFAVDAITSVVVGYILLLAYSKTRTKTGSLTKE
ncbi:MAG: ECF-type riboflavin transporter substrate-binding protein [Firmicutes bacterium]|nr:ECF-type riboflavin transporter substrate-binding protein [Bacillota bacterium]